MNNSPAPFEAHWLSAVSDDTITSLKNMTDVVDFAEGDVVYALGGPQTWVWGLVHGQVQIRVALIETEPVLAHIYHAGAWFGESELLHGVDGLIEVRATEPTRMARIPYPVFRRLANTRPELWQAFALLASMNQLLAMSAANDLSLRKPNKRIAATLLRLCGLRGNFQRSGTVHEIKASQQDLANLANIARSKASIHLNAMADADLVSLSYGRVRLLDSSRLSDLIEE